MRFWFDTEFIEDNKMIDLISIGIVAEDGRSLYRENADCDLTRASPWVIENVINKLSGVSRLPQHDAIAPSRPYRIGGPNACPRRLIARDMREFVGSDTNPQFWAYYADYDWVVLCQLFGTMMDLPKGWPMYCRDVKQLCDELGNPALPEQGDSEHHALAGALRTKAAWEFLQQRRL